MPADLWRESGKGHLSVLGRGRRHGEQLRLLRRRHTLNELTFDGGWDDLLGYLR